MRAEPLWPPLWLITIMTMGVSHTDPRIRGPLPRLEQLRVEFEMEKAVEELAVARLQKNWVRIKILKTTGSNNSIRSRSDLSPPERQKQGVKTFGPTPAFPILFQETATQEEPAWMTDGFSRELSAPFWGSCRPAESGNH